LNCRATLIHSFQPRLREAKGLAVAVSAQPGRAMPSKKKEKDRGANF
jgi:hypothetical protein